MSDSRVVVTGTAWMGGGAGAIDSALEEIFREARQEILLTAYAISSGADLLLEWLEVALSRGVQTRFVINRLNTQPREVVARLKGFMTVYNHFYLYDFDAEEGEDLHAKAVVADREVALVGSSNLSRRGLLKNLELAVVIRGETASDVAAVIDRLMNSQRVVRLTPVGLD